MEQLALDYRTPMARRRDPAGSHRAADLLERTGKRAAQRRRVLRVVLRDPGRSSREYAARWPDLGYDRYTFARVLPELRDGGYVESAEGDTGRRELRWTATDRARAWAGAPASRRRS